MATTQTVNIDVNANTSDAQQDIAKLENNIQTLDGAINLVGGSIEVLAGTLALTGAVTEEQAQRFESAAVGAIALADGSKRILEGYRTLKTATDAATASQAANNATVLANPYIAAAVALAALTAGIYLFVKARRVEITEENRREGALNQARKAAEAATIAQNEYNRALEEEFTAADNSIRILKARGASVREIFEAEKALALLRIESARALVTEEERQNEELRKVIEVNEEVERTTGGVVNGNKELKESYEANKQELSDAKKSLNDLETELKLLKIEYTSTTSATDDNTEALERNAQAAADTELEYAALADRLDKIFEEQLSDQDRELNAVQDKYFQLLEFYKDDAEIFAFLTEAKRKEEQVINEKYDKIAEESVEKRSKLAQKFASDEAAAIEAQLNAVSQLTSAFVEVIDDGTEQGFEASKKYKIAEVITSSALAAFQAFAAAQQFGPVLGPILGTAQVAAITVAANRAIADIRAGEFNGGSSVPGGVGTPSTPQFQQGTQTIGGATGTVVPQTQERTAMRAYVVSSDIRNAAEEEGAIRRRRTL